MSLIFFMKCVVFINFYCLTHSEIEASLSLREQDKPNAIVRTHKTHDTDNYPNSMQQQDHLEFKLDEGLMSKLRKKKKRIVRKKKHTKWNVEDNEPEKEVSKKKHVKRKDNEVQEKNKKKKISKNSRRFIKTPVKEDRDSAESMENSKKMSPVDIIVHIKMNEMN